MSLLSVHVFSRMRHASQSTALWKVACVALGQAPRPTRTRAALFLESTSPPLLDGHPALKEAPCSRLGIARHQALG